MPGDWLVGPRGECLAAAANGQQHLAWAVRRDGYSNPPDRADQALRRATYGVHGHITGFHLCAYIGIPPLFSGLAGTPALLAGLASRIT